MMRLFYCVLLLLFSTTYLWSQEQVIEINNPSFEDRPHRGGGSPLDQINGWYDCGLLQFRHETPPDIHPINAWQVTKTASDGNTYLGMVVRDNDTWESVAQRLPSSIESGKCYTFSIELSRSDFYISGSRKTRSLENYTQPAVLRIWGGAGICGKQELLGESVTVTNDEWRTFEFKFEPKRTINYFTLESFYKTPSLFPYNGHILLDNASSIVEVPCDEEQLLAKESSIQTVAHEEKEERKISKKTAPVPVAEMLQPKVETTLVENNSVVEEKEIVQSQTPNIKGLHKDHYHPGEIIRIHSIYFAMDSTKVMRTSQQAIEELYQFMRRNPNIVIEIGGHTNTAPAPSYCDQLSSTRAKEVAKILVSKGISPKRLYFKGYGKRKPIIVNDRHDFKARQKNQRVEIKILQTDFKSS